MATILIVEDSQAEQQLLTEYLTAGGYTVVHAGSSEEAVTTLEQVKPSAIFLDVVLPGRSGFELCRDLKAAPDTSQIPIIICSTKNSEMDKFWGMKQGADAYLGKPLEREVVLDTARKVIA
ncbi:MAG: response regulator transcription factor [Synechococcus sp.]